MLILIKIRVQARLFAKGSCPVEVGKGFKKKEVKPDPQKFVMQLINPA